MGAKVWVWQWVVLFIEPDSSQLKWLWKFPGMFHIILEVKNVGLLFVCMWWAVLFLMGKDIFWWRGWVICTHTALLTSQVFTLEIEKSKSSSLINVWFQYEHSYLLWFFFSQPLFLKKWQTVYSPGVHCGLEDSKFPESKSIQRMPWIALSPASVDFIQFLLCFYIHAKCFALSF